jgi:hypothetical protein
MDGCHWFNWLYWIHWGDWNNRIYRMYRTLWMDRPFRKYWVQRIYWC